MYDRLRDLLHALHRRLWREERPLPYLGRINDGTGWKVARLKDPAKGTFRGLAHGEYGFSEIALCDNNVDHTPPVHKCGCGFYAHRKRSEAVNYLGYRKGLVLLKVEMYGEIVVHTKGIRAAEQEIVGVYIPGHCTEGSCTATTAGVKRRRRNWVAVCDNHIGKRHHLLRDLSARWGIDVGTC